MWWRQTAKEFAAAKGDRNREAFRSLVLSGAQPGILAYAKDVPVGWCAVAPRGEYPRLARSRTLKPIDEKPVWSITCFYVARDARRRGVLRGLIQAACLFVGTRGGRIVEAYPLVPDDAAYPDAFAYTGFLPTFLACGFRDVARPSPRRAVVRRDVSADTP